jgi:hypothetical protein
MVFPSFSRTVEKTVELIFRVRRGGSNSQLGEVEGWRDGLGEA